MFCSFVQLDKTIPPLLEMKDDLKCPVTGQNEMKSDLKCLVAGQNEMTDETKDMREDTAVRNNVEWQARVEKDIRIIRSKLGIR